MARTPSETYEFDTRGRRLKGWTNELIWGDNKLILSPLKSGALCHQIAKLIDIVPHGTEKNGVPVDFASRADSPLPTHSKRRLPGIAQHGVTQDRPQRKPKMHTNQHRKSIFAIALAGLAAGAAGCAAATSPAETVTEPSADKHACGGQPGEKHACGGEMKESDKPADEAAPAPTDPASEHDMSKTPAK